MTAFDPVAFKATTRDQWNAVADHWNAWGPFIQRWLGPATEAMLKMAQIGAGSRVLIVAGGSGQEAVQIAERVGPEGYVLTTDISEKLTELARQNASAAGLRNIDAQLADSETIDVAPGSFDAALSRVGLIFFPDQADALARQIAALKPGGFVGAVVYSTAEECRFFSDPIAIIRRHADLPPPMPGQPGPFSLGAPGRIEQLFSEAGLVDIQAKRIPSPVIMESAAECLRFELESFGALHQMLAKLDEDAKRAAWDEVGQALAAFETGGRFEGPCTMIAAIGRKP